MQAHNGSDPAHAARERHRYEVMVNDVMQHLRNNRSRVDSDYRGTLPRQPQWRLVLRRWIAAMFGPG